MNKKFFLALASLFTVISCQKSPILRTQTWTVNSKTPAPELNQVSLSASQSTLRYADELVEIKNQTIGAAKVSSASVSLISKPNGSPVYLKTTLLDTLSEKETLALAKKSYSLDVKKFALLERLKKKSPHLASAQEIFSPVLMIEKLGPRAAFFFNIDFIDKTGLGVYRLRANSEGGIEDIRRIELCFSEAKSLVFPAGPKLSDLQQELLKNLIGDGTLNSTLLHLSSADGSAVIEPNGQFIFEPDDLRFDQVQAFYFVQKSLQYAESKWGISLPAPLKVQLRTGFPEKTNAAFYYQGLIRLGDGDGKTYSHIPRDPSIISHEVAHSIIDKLSAMSSEGEAGSINEGFADFLTASMWDNPQLGHTAYLKAPYKRSVDNPRTFKDLNGGLYFDSALISGTFWDIRKALGPQKSQLLALKTIARLGHSPTFLSVRSALIDAAAEANLSENELAQIPGLLDKRAWP